MKHLFIYIAAPYTSNPERNTLRALEAADKIIEKGHIPFVPHLYHSWHKIKPRTYDEWARLAGAFIDKCDAIFRLPGESAGADREVEIARKKGLILYFSLDEIPKV